MPLIDLREASVGELMQWLGLSPRDILFGLRQILEAKTMVSGLGFSPDEDFLFILREKRQQLELVATEDSIFLRGF